MDKKIKTPVTAGKVAKVPVILQLEALECCAASLAMVMAYYNKWIPLEQVRVDCGVSHNFRSVEQRQKWRKSTFPKYSENIVKTPEPLRFRG